LCDFYSTHIEGPILINSGISFEHDGVPFQFAVIVEQFLNEIFPNWLEGVVQELGQHAYQICPHCTFSYGDMLKL
jgi:hypothetical protein